MGAWQDRLRRTSTAAATVVLALSIAGCRDTSDSESSNRGSSSETVMTSVDNAYIVPLHIAGRCSIQAGDSAKLRFTATNNRDAETERLLYITTDAADAVRISPDTGIEIPPGSTITADEPTSRPGAASLDVDVNGLREALEPGMSVDVTFGFDKAGRIEMRTPVEACPRQSPPSP